MILDEFSNKVIGLAIEVHQNLGPGLLESTYEACLCHELFDAGIDFQKQVSIPVVYKNVSLSCGYRADIIVGKSLLLELKAVDRITPLHEAQILTYLKLAGLKLGLLLNFNSVLLKNGIRRFVL